MPRFQSLLPSPPEPERLRQLPPLRPFSPEARGFIDALSVRLLRTPALKRYPELVALGFWMRAANLTRLRNQFLDSAPQSLFQARGTAFHIAPSNVDSIFIYSWFLSMLCGNKNIVRLSSRSSPQLELLVDALADLLVQDTWRAIAERTLLVRYEHDAEVTAYFSTLCNIRVVWGGDATIAQIRQVPLPPLACETAFANKFSLALIHAKSWNEAAPATQQEWTGQFFNDAYWFAQMACSSPRLVVWDGDRESVRIAQEVFWSGLARLAGERQTGVMPVDCVNKLVALDRIALRFPGAAIRESGLGLISRLEIAHQHVRRLIDADLHCGAGLFYETAIDGLEDLLPMLDRRIQTVAYAGYGDGSALREFACRHALQGIDRLIPFGRALEFSPVWDGFDLFRVFSRQLAFNEGRS